LRVLTFMKKTDIQKGLEHDARRVKERVPEQVTDEEIKRVHCRA